MSTAERLLPRLDGVRQVAQQRWVAKCPAHEDRSPSLSIRETDDGRILVHDFGGCPTTEVLASLGMTVTDLFPERITHHAKSLRPNHWHAMREALKTLCREALVVAIAAEDIAAGRDLSADDAARVAVAAGRIRGAVEVCA